MFLNKILVAAIALLVLGQTGVALARRVDAGPVRDKGSPASTAKAGLRDRFMHDVGNVRMTLTNWGEQGNPDELARFFGFEFPFGSENDFLFSAGIWVGAIKGGERLVSTGTDGDDGTNDFAPTMDSYVLTSKQYSELAGKTYIKGAKGIDDDGDWWDHPEADLDGDGKPSDNWDGGAGFIGRDDDGDGLVDEEEANGIDDDGDGLIDEDTFDGDANGDGNCGYDPEPYIDEDPAGDISCDYIDNDFDGLVDASDPDYDGDKVPGSNDDDGDGLQDEDGVARGTQEYFCVYDDTDVSEARNPDPDGHIPLNIMVLQRSYAWPEAYASEFILVDLIIRNVGTVPLNDVHIGLFADPDVAAKGESGDPASVDDWNYYDEENLMMIQGDDTTDADGFGPGLFAMKVVRTPAPLEDLNVVFKNFERVAGGDPDNNADKFDMLSDDPANNSPPTPALGDWRFLMGFSPREGSWKLKPGEELPVTVAFIAAEDKKEITATGEVISMIGKNAKTAQAIYDNDFQGYSAPDQPEFELESYIDHIRIYWNDNSEDSEDPILKKSDPSIAKDFEGYIIERSSNLNYWWALAQYDIINRLPEPLYERENLNLGMPYDLFPEGTNWRWTEEIAEIDTVVDPPDTTFHREYWYDDYDVLRGWTYYYIVRAFDQGVEGAGVLITGRSAYESAIVGANAETSTLGNSVDEVFVVPNPYRGSHAEEGYGWENEAGVKLYPRKLKFMNLPASVMTTINIYTLAGDHIVTLENQPGDDILIWDMRNKYEQEIMSGIYYYVVESEGDNIKIDKFVVLK